MTEEIRKRIEDARNEAELELGFEVPDDMAKDILELCIRKCECNGKGEEYLPIMYRYELPIKFYLYELNSLSVIASSIRKEVEKYVRPVPDVTVSSQLP